MTVDCETWYRVPRSAEECAVHLEAGGVVEFWTGEEWDKSVLEAPGLFRRWGAPTSEELATYRLVYSTPVGMSPVIGAPGHAYGLAKDASEGWVRRDLGDDRRAACAVPAVPAIADALHRDDMVAEIIRYRHGLGSVATSDAIAVLYPEAGK